jgi:hypothetical protein
LYVYEKENLETLRDGDAIYRHPGRKNHSEWISQNLLFLFLSEILPEKKMSKFFEEQLGLTGKYFTPAISK